jgi:hypothetical protein
MGAGDKRAAELRTSIINCWTCFKRQPGPRPADRAIFDTADLAEQPLSGLQTRRIPDQSAQARKLYRRIWTLVPADTDAYEESACLSLRGMRDSMQPEY